MKKLLLLFSIILFLIHGCATSEKALNKGYYDLAIQKATKKLRKHPDKTSEILILEKAFQKAQQDDFDRIALIQKEGSPDHWDEIYAIYLRIKNRQAAIKTLPDLQVRDNYKKVVRNAQFNITDVA